MDEFCYRKLRFIAHSRAFSLISVKWCQNMDAGALQILKPNKSRSEALQNILFQIFIIEFTRGQLNADGDRCKLRLFNWDVPCETQKIYKFFGYFSFGAAVTQTITDITKYSIGRLRPHFISVRVFGSFSDCLSIRWFLKTFSSAILRCQTEHLATMFKI